MKGTLRANKRDWRVMDWINGVGSAVSLWGTECFLPTHSWLVQSHMWLGGTFWHRSGGNLSVQQVVGSGVHESCEWLEVPFMSPPFPHVVGECSTSPASATADWGGFHKSPKWGEGGEHPMGRTIMVLQDRIDMLLIE